MPNRDPYRYFRIEARDLAGQLGQGVAALGRDGGREVVSRLLRLAHTLKGAARVVRLTDIADKAHAIEDVLAPFRAGEAPVSPAAIDEVLRLVDAVTGRLETLDGPAATAPVETDAASAASPGAAMPTPSALLDVSGIDAVLDGLGEAYGELAALDGAEAATGRMRILADTLRDQLGATRPALAASAAQLLDLARGLERDLATGGRRARRELDAAREAAERLRLLRASTLFPNLERTARDVARTLGRRVAVTCAGGDIRIDAEAMRPLQDALIQLVRNAVAHGIEPPAERERAGKPAEGRLAIGIELRGRSIAVTVADDGRGIDEAALRAARPTAASAPGLLDLLLAGGATTADAVTHASGRGIGMDIVREALESLRGALSVDTAPGTGTRFELTLPVSLSLVDALLVEAGDAAVMLPLAAVHAARRIAAHEVRPALAGDLVSDDGAAIPFVMAGRLLGGKAGAPHGTVTALVLRSAAGNVGVGVGRILGTVSVLLRALPELAPASPLVAGAALDAVGRPVLLLDAERLAATVREAGSPGEAEPVSRRQLLVVDDSLTTRMLEQSILEAAGYEVDVATSGEEGLERARAGAYALILCDVEMPGMDGFAFVEALRRDPVLHATPAILVTSRDAPEDKLRGETAGAQGYVVKSEFDQADLLGRIERLVA